MLNNFAATQAGGSGTVTTTTILDGTIANADVASDAAIAVSKIDLGNTLEIETSSGDQIFEMDNNASNSSNFQIQNGAGNARADLALDGSAIITLKNQMVGIGDTSPSYALDVNTTGRFTTDLIVGGNLTVGDGGAEDQKVVFNGNAQDFYVGLDDSADDLVIGLGSAVGTTPSISINSDRDVTISDGAIDFDVASHDGTNGLKLGGALVTSSATELNLLDGVSSLGTGDASGPGSATDNAIARFNGTGGKTLQNSSTTISDDGDIVVGGTTPTITIGDGGAEDSMLAFDGNALDFHISLDDSADDLVIGTGTTAGTATLVSINGDGTETIFAQPKVTIGDATAEDTMLAFDGNALDFHISLDDSADDLVIGTGTTAGSNTLISINGDGSETKFNQPKVTIGDATAEDTYIIFDGNAQDFRIGLDDGTDKLEIGGGAAHGTAAGISMDVNGDMTLGGGIACADEVIGRPRFTDYSETVNALGTKTAAFDIDVEAGNVQTLTMSGGGTFNIGLVNALSSHSNSVTILGTNLGSCTATVLAGANGGGGNAVHWAGGGDTTNNLCTSSGVDVVTFTTFDGGTNWYGFVAGKAFGNS